MNKKDKNATITYEYFQLNYAKQEVIVSTLKGDITISFDLINQIHEKISNNLRR